LVVLGQNVNEMTSKCEIESASASNSLTSLWPVCDDLKRLGSRVAEVVTPQLFGFFGDTGLLNDAPIDVVLIALGNGNPSKNTFKLTLAVTVPRVESEKVQPIPLLSFLVAAAVDSDDDRERIRYEQTVALHILNSFAPPPINLGNCSCSSPAGDPECGESHHSAELSNEREIPLDQRLAWSQKVKDGCEKKRRFFASVCRNTRVPFSLPRLAEGYDWYIEEWGGTSLANPAKMAKILAKPKKVGSESISKPFPARGSSETLCAAESNELQFEFAEKEKVLSSVSDWEGVGRLLARIHGGVEIEEFIAKVGSLEFQSPAQNSNLNYEPCSALGARKAVLHGDFHTAQIVRSKVPIHGVHGEIFQCDDDICKFLAIDFEDARVGCVVEDFMQLLPYIDPETVTNLQLEEEDSSAGVGSTSAEVNDSTTFDSSVKVLCLKRKIVAAYADELAKFECAAVKFSTFKCGDSEGMSTRTSTCKKQAPKCSDIDALIIEAELCELNRAGPKFWSAFSDFVGFQDDHSNEDLKKMSQQIRRVLKNSKASRADSDSRKELTRKELTRKEDSPRFDSERASDTDKDLLGQRIAACPLCQMILRHGFRRAPVVLQILRDAEERMLHQEIAHQENEMLQIALEQSLFEDSPPREPS